MRDLRLFVIVGALMMPGMILLDLSEQQAYAQNCTTQCVKVKQNAYCDNGEYDQCGIYSDYTCVQCPGNGLSNCYQPTYDSDSCAKTDVTILAYSASCTAGCPCSETTPDARPDVGSVKAPLKTIKYQFAQPSNAVQLGMIPDPVKKYICYIIGL